MTQLTQTCSILSTLHDGVLYLTLNRPAVLNAIDMEMAKTLLQHLQDASGNTAVRAIVITGSDRAFCSGGDLKFAVEVNPETPGDSFLALTAVLHQCIEAIRTIAKPVVASINGVAAGAGLFLALACDLRIMADTAYLKQSNTSYGLTTPAGGTFMLPRLVGMGRTMEIMMLDRPIDAQHASDIGLVNRVVSSNALITETQALANEAAKMPIETLGRIKRLLNQSFYQTLHEQLEAERLAIALSANSSEGREGLAAFLQKRSPVFAHASQLSVQE